MPPFLPSFSCISVPATVPGSTLEDGHRNWSSNCETPNDQSLGRSPKRSDPREGRERTKGTEPQNQSEVSFGSYSHFGHHEAPAMETSHMNSSKQKQKL